MGIFDAVGGILSAVTGARSQAKALDTQQENLAFQRDIAERILDAQLGTTIDANGNIVTYDEATNTFKTIPSEMTQEILGAQNTELLRQLTEDAGRRRIEFQRNFDLRTDTGNVADTALDAYEDAIANPQRREEIEGVLLERALRGIAQEFDKTRGAVARQAVRSGSTTGDRQLGELSRQQAEAARDAALEATAQSFGLTEDVNNARFGRLGRAFEGLAGRASNLDNVPINFSNAAEALGTTLDRRATGATGAGQVASSGVGNAFNNLSAYQNRQESALPGIVTGIGAALPSIQGLFKKEDTFGDRQVGNRSTG